MSINLVLDLDNTVISALSHDEYLKLSETTRKNLRKNLKKRYMTEADIVSGGYQDKIVYHVYIRPYLQYFLKYCYDNNFKITVWTAADENYGQWIIDKIINKTLIDEYKFSFVRNKIINYLIEKKYIMENDRYTLNGLSNYELLDYLDFNRLLEEIETNIKIPYISIVQHFLSYDDCVECMIDKRKENHFCDTMKHLDYLYKIYDDFYPCNTIIMDDHKDIPLCNKNKVISAKYFGVEVKNSKPEDDDFLLTTAIDKLRVARHNYDVKKCNNH